MKFRMTFGKPIRYFLDDEEVSEKEYRAKSTNRMGEVLEGGGTNMGQSSSAWPMRSEALACHRDQIPEMMERNKKKGVVGVTYDKDGTAVLADRGARRSLLRAEGFHDNSGGFGD